jgi:hypothetical protein
MVSLGSVEEEERTTIGLSQQQPTNYGSTTNV